jgi:hypothetical protein
VADSNFYIFLIKYLTIIYSLLDDFILIIMVIINVGIVTAENGLPAFSDIFLIDHILTIPDGDKFTQIKKEKFTRNGLVSIYTII